MARPPRDPAPEAGAARSRALRALGRREHGARELENELAAQGLPEAQAAEIVDELKRNGWQSDARYAEVLVRSRIAQGYGRLRIEAELSTRGVDDIIIRTALEQADCDWAALAAEVRRKRFGAAPAGFADAQKQYRFLAARGFEAEQIRQVLKGVVPDSID